MTELAPLPDDLPWTLPAYLLIDGASAPDLVRHLRNWGNPAHCLYQNTRWHTLTDISPYLISVPGADDPCMAHFLENAAYEWGYLFFSGASAYTLCQHWRQVLVVDHPCGLQVMPRIADPAVMHEMFSLAGVAQSARWFGPVEHACLPDAMQGTWLQHQRPVSGDGQQHARYSFTEEELTVLGEVEFRRSVLALSVHMQTYFPEYAASGSARQRMQSIRSIAQQAYDLGFTSEQQITLYANVYGYLADQKMSDHQDIVHLLSNSLAGPHLSRVKRAAELAQSRAVFEQGSQP